jgi:hypothetical protein
MTKILVSIVNYCDPEFFDTVKYVWKTAKNKNNLIISLVSEDPIKYNFDFIPKKQIIYKHFDEKEYRGGLCWARKMSTDVNVEYDYLMQFDSHTYLLYGWDQEILDNYKKIKETFSTNNEKFLIAYAPADYEINEDGTIKIDVKMNTSRTASIYKDLVPGFLFPKYKKLNLNEVALTYWPTCAFLFAPKKWVDEVGFSEISAFNTEEIDLALNTFNMQWKIYSIGSNKVMHNTSHKQASGTFTRFIHRPWADDRKEKYWEHVEKATRYTSHLMSGKKHINISTLLNFFEVTGINKKYLNYNPDYYNHIKNTSSPFDHVAMPPRKNIDQYKNMDKENI